MYYESVPPFQSWFEIRVSGEWTSTFSQKISNPMATNPNDKIEELQKQVSDMNAARKAAEKERDSVAKRRTVLVWIVSFVSVGLGVVILDENVDSIDLNFIRVAVITIVAGSSLACVVCLALKYLGLILTLDL